MKVKALGSSGGRVPGQALSSFLVDDNTLIDIGGACSALDLKAQLNIDRVLISHSHLDHTYSLAFILESRTGHDVKPLEIVSTQDVIKIIQNDLLNNKVWPDFTHITGKNGKPMLKYKPILTGKKIRLGKYTVEAIDVNHPVPAVGFVITDGIGTLFYTGDMGPTPAVWQKIKTSKTRIDALVTELSFPNQMEALAMISGHLTPDMLEDGMISAGIVDTPVYLTHLKPNFIKTLIKELDRLPRSNIHVLKDGASFVVKSNGRKN